jgi:antitoxin component YwqK of YwqJK toxin-antitoxin module
LKGQYKSGNKSGTWKDYYQDGRLFEENTYRDNEYNGFQKVFHPNGNLAVLGEAINGKEEGDWLILDLDGDTLKIEKYKAGEIIHVKQFKESEKANYSNNY